jgi:sn-glycerol 3-phosphate transport system ATP-binding protein
VILMSAGHVEQNGSPVDLYEDPANTFVARFIGTPPMSLLRLEAGPGGAVIAGGDGTVVAASENAGAILGLRPEHIVLARGDGVLALVTAVEYLGADSMLACSIGDQPLISRIAGRVAIAKGDMVHLKWAAGAAHYFDGQTGRRRSSSGGDAPVTWFA